MFSGGIEKQWRRSGMLIVNIEYISHLDLVFLLLTLNMQLPAGFTILAEKLNHRYLTGS